MPAPPATARAALWVALLATLVRLLYLVEHAGSAFFGVPILDEAYYDGLARALLSGGGEAAVMNPAFRPWGYPLFLAGAHHLGDPWGRPLAVVLQHVLGVVTVVLVVWLAARILRSAAGGAVAGSLYALAGPPLYYEGELLIAGLYTFLLTVLVVVWGRLGSDTDAKPATGALGLQRLIPWLAVGLLCALAMQARANALLVLPLLPVVAWIADRRQPGHGRRFVARLTAAAVGLVGTQLAFAGFQHRVTGTFSLMPSAGGVNLYLGNKRGADGMVPRQDWHVTYNEAYRDSVEVFAEEGFQRAHPTTEATPGRISHYWRQRALAEVIAAPMDWLALMGRKTSYLLWHREIPNNKRYAFVTAEESPLLAALPVRWWLLFALAPLGIHYAWHHGDRRRLAWLLGIASVHAAGVVLFFVTARYRIPLWPLAAVLAAGGVLWLVQAVRRRSTPAIAAGLSVTLVAATISLLPRSDASWPNPGRDYFFRSIAWLERGDADAAVADARTSVALDPDDGASWLQLGNALEASQAPAAALDAYRQAARRRPDEPRVHNNIGVVLEALDRPAAAYAAYRQTLGMAPDYAPALVNAALLELRAGLFDKAATRVERARERGFDSVSLRVAVALVVRAQGDEARFTTLLAPIEREHPEAVARLLHDQERPVELSRLHAAAPAQEPVKGPAQESVKEPLP